MISYNLMFSEVIEGVLALDIPVDFAFLIAEFNGTPESRRYIWTKVKCRICQYEFLTIYPSNIFDETILECESCGHRCCESVANDFIKLDFTDG